MRLDTNRSCSTETTNIRKYAVNWLEQHGPKMVRTKQGETFVDTKFSRLLGRLPIMVAGMTPSTAPWDFVASTLNVGYQIELAGKYPVFAWRAQR